MIACTLLAALVAFALFGLATDRHHEQRFARRCPARTATAMRCGGWAMILVTFVCAIAGWGPVYGPIAAVGVMMLAAGAACLSLNLLPVRRRG